MKDVKPQYLISDRYLFRPDKSVIENLVSEEQLLLGNNENKLLIYFCNNPGETVSREQIQKYVWQDNGFQVDDSSLTQSIFTLRKMLGDSSKKPEFILTVPRQGYRFIAAIDVREDSSVSEEDSMPSAVSISDNSSNDSGAGHRSDYRFLMKAKYPFMLVLALFLPVYMYFSLLPETSDYRSIRNIQGIPIKTENGHTFAKKWDSVLEQCVSNYVSNENLESLPAEVIVGSSPVRMILNFVHEPEFSDQNLTVSVLAHGSSPAASCNDPGSLR